MHFIRHTSIVKRVALGFAAATVLLLLLASVTIFGLMTTADGFDEYRSIARLTNQAGRIQANLLEARLAVKNFIISSSDDAVSAVRSRVEQTKKLAVEMRALATGERQIKTADSTISAIGDYEAAFEDVVELQTKRDRLVEGTVNTLGPKMEEASKKIVTSVASGDRREDTHHAANLRADLMEMRVATKRFLLVNNAENFDEAIADSNLAVEEIAALKTSPAQELTIEVDRLRAEYVNALQELKPILAKRDSVIIGQLDRIGPALAVQLEDFKLELKGRQDEIGPEITGEVQSAEIIAITVSGMSILAAIAMAFLIARSISSPVRSITQAMSTLANGNLEADIPGRDLENEIGEMARAVEVFKQNGIKVREMNAQEAVLQAKSADLQSSIGEVVSAAISPGVSARTMTMPTSTASPPRSMSW